jgi:hypothetical protein
VVLQSGTGDGREFEIAAVYRRAIHTDAVLRDSEDDLDHLFFFLVSYRAG